MAHEVHQVGGILAVVNREGWIKPDLFGVLAQEPRADPVKGAAPGKRINENPFYSAVNEQIKNDD